MFHDYLLFGDKFFAVNKLSGRGWGAEVASGSLRPTEGGTREWRHSENTEIQHLVTHSKTGASEINYILSWFLLVCDKPLKALVTINISNSEPQEMAGDANFTISLATGLLSHLQLQMYPLVTLNPLPHTFTLPPHGGGGGLWIDK